MTRDTETDEPAARSVEALYDAFAPALYRYAWSLLGGGPDPDRATTTDPAAPTPAPGGPGAEDPVADAVHDALVAGVVLDGERADPADRGPWLYALVRSACQRRGFAHTCPYTRLATVPAEAPVARMFSRLPASHRELVELNLRHALPRAAVARVLGLDEQICGELSRSAIRRAAEGLEDLPDHDRPLAPGEEDPAATNWRAQAHQVSSALSLLRPPGPPPGLRPRIVRTGTDPELAAERGRIGASMRPLTSDGYPLHRSLPPGPAREEPKAGAASEPAAEPSPRALPGDRLTTGDHPVRDEPVTPLARPGGPHGPGAEEDEAARRRWPLAAVSGLATVVLAVVLWSWAGLVGGPTAVIGTGPAGSARSPLAEVEAVSTASDGKPAAEPTSTVPHVPGASAEPPQGTDGAGGSDPAGTEEDGQADPGQGGDTSGPSAGQAGTPPQDAPSDPEEEHQDAGGGTGEDSGGEGGGDSSGANGGGGLLSGLLGLFLGEG